MNTPSCQQAVSPPEAFSQGLASHRKHVVELTSLRGLAALCVLLSHVLVLFPPLKEGFFLPLLKQCGILGMSLFFTLSGFVIFYNYAQRLYSSPLEGIKVFFIARFARLFPLYIVFLLAFFLFNMFFAGQDINEIAACTISLPLWVLGMQSWIYGFVNDIPLVYLQGRASLLWSVSTELALYCIFIPLCFLLFRIRKAWQMCAALVLACAMHGAYVYISNSDGALTSYINDQFSVYKGFKAWQWLFYYSPFGRIFEFSIGCLAAVVHMHGMLSSKKDLMYSVFSVVMLLCVVLLTMYPLEGEMAFIVQPLFVAGFVFCVAQCGARMLRFRVLVYMGEISYSTYLLHAMWLQLLQYSGEDGWARWAIFVVYIVGTYSLAHVVYTRWETPSRRWVRNLLSSVRFSSGIGRADAS